MTRLNWFLNVWCSLLLVLYGLSSQAGDAAGLYGGMELGVTKGRAISNGFVFVGGHYLDAPYLIKREGVAVFINEELVATLAEWPPLDLRVYEKPELPKDLNKESTFADIENVTNRFDGFIPRIWRYYHQHFPSQEAMDRIAAECASLPFVKKMTRQDGFIILETFSGYKRRIRIDEDDIQGALFPPPTKEVIVASVNDYGEHIRKMLEEGCALFFFTNGQQQALSPQMVAKELPFIVKLLNSDQTSEVKLQKLCDLQLLNAYKSTRWVDFVKRFRGSEQLGDRIEDMHVDIRAWEEKRQEDIDWEKKRHRALNAKKRELQR